MRSDIPKVSLGLLVYNGESFLAETLESLLSQAFEDFELVISDNGSTDATQDICEASAARDLRVRYVRQPVNRGAAWNFNEVFRLCKGEYFKWCSHDDPCEVGFLGACVDVLDRNPAVAWCMTGIEVIDRFGRRLEGVDASCSGAAQPITPEESRNGRTLRLAEDLARPHDRFSKVLLGRTACMDMWGLMRSDVLTKTGLWRHYRGAEKVLMAELAILGNGVQLPMPLAKYRFHSDASIALADFRSQQRWCDPNRNWRYVFPRLSLVRDFIQVAARHPIGTVERARCLLAVWKYLMQLRKWRSAVRRMLQGTGLDEDNRERIRRIETVAPACQEAAVEKAISRSGRAS
ncbi:MAG: glycosyltransferase family 2 protein [Thermoguttaceae bacterium]